MDEVENSDRATLPDRRLEAEMRWSARWGHLRGIGMPLGIGSYCLIQPLYSNT